MTWKRPAEKDAAVKAWMKAKGWELNRRQEYDFDREVYVWRHEVSGGNSPTLRISRKVLEAPNNLAQRGTAGHVRIKALHAG